jgi:hypothetical protein
MTDLGRKCTWDQALLGTNMADLEPNHTWDQNALGTKIHLGSICTWDHDGLGTGMHLGPWRTWDQYAFGTMTDLGPICTWDHDGLGTNMADLGPICTWDQYALGTRPRHPPAWLELAWVEPSQAREILTRVKPENPWLDNQVKFICLEIFISLIQNRQKGRLRAKFWKLRLIKYYLLLKVATSKPDNFVSKLNGTLNKKKCAKSWICSIYFLLNDHFFKWNFLY